jgi:flagellar hook-basal body complex protein FliE
MANPIAPIAPIAGLPPIQAPGQASAPGVFQSVLEGAIRTIETGQSNAGEAVQKFLSGENEEVHTMALALQQAQLTFDLGLQVRNKVVEAYQEVMRMQM